MRVAARHARVLADRQRLVDRAGCQFVIPGPSRARSPEPMNTDGADQGTHDRGAWPGKPAFMGSGLAALPRPGMTNKATSARSPSIPSPVRRRIATGPASASGSLSRSVPRHCWRRHADGRAPRPRPYRSPAPRRSPRHPGRSGLLNQVRQLAQPAAMAARLIGQFVIPGPSGARSPESMNTDGAD